MVCKLIQLWNTLDLSQIIQQNTTRYMYQIRLVVVKVNIRPRRVLPPALDG
jgi:hypothetical protein